MSRLAFFAAAVVFGLLGGCASYQLGEPTVLPYRTLTVAPPKNLSTLPQFEAPLASALRQSILQAGPVELASSGAADAVIELTVVEIKRDIAAVTAEDVGRGRKFELNVSLELTLREPVEGGQVYLDRRPFSVKQDIYSDRGLVDAEYQATPELSNVIAERAVEMIVDHW